MIRHSILVLMLLCLLFVVSCTKSAENELVGEWKGQQDEDGIMVFHKNGMFEGFDKDKASLFEGKQKPSMTWEAITEVEPHQIYIILKAEGKVERMPLGIYKIENGKLILRQPTTYHRTIGGLDMGVSRYEMPKDFSGILQVFERIE